MAHPNAAHCEAPPFPSQGWDFTNYLVYPTNTVIAGAPSASPSNGVFILTDGPAAGRHSLPTGAGVPTITKWDPPDTVHFTTTTGDTGTLDVSTGKITILPASAPSTVPTQPTSAPQPLSLISVAMTSRDHGYALAADRQGGAATSVVATSDGGARWQTVEQLSAAGREIVAPDATHAFLVADCVRQGCTGSVVMGTTDGGKSWTTLKTLAGTLYAVSFVSDAEGWALVGDAGAAVLHTTDGGKTWSALRNPCGKGGGALAFANSRDGWISCIGEGGGGPEAKTVFRTQEHPR